MFAGLLLDKERVKHAKIATQQGKGGKACLSEFQYRTWGLTEFNEFVHTF